MAGHRQNPLDIDTSERGAAHADGTPQKLDKRLFMQLGVWTVKGETTAHWANRITESLHKAGVPCVAYQDACDPQAVGILTWSIDAEMFATKQTQAMQYEVIKDASLRHDMTMFGRTYSSGYEPDLEYWMLKRPIENVIDEKSPWAVWYPLRRSGAFEKLEPRDKGRILREHGTIGKAYGEKGYATDVRLACHGIDTNDNEFLIGLVGAELHPLSHLVQRMRGTEQTSTYIEKMGPFFVGHRIAMKA